MLTFDITERIRGKYDKVGPVEGEQIISTKHRTIDKESQMMLQANKKFFKRQSANVKENYLMTDEEVTQKLATINLFEKFDFDASGALDVMELTALYNENGIKITEDEIRELYQDESVLFTLDMFS